MSPPDLGVADAPVAFLTTTSRARLRQIARQRSPLETGGLLWGHRLPGPSWRVCAIRELPDPHATARTYRAPPRDVWTHLRDTLPDGAVVVGMFHTHPDSPPTASPVDSKFASPGYLHAIVGRDGPRRPIRVFRRAAPNEPLAEVVVGAFRRRSDPSEGRRGRGGR
jgi:proteasome lid subunit RPN8/RPN11